MFATALRSLRIIEVSAHCDLPRGVYDPAQARIEAESIKAIDKKVADSDDPDFRVRAAIIKEQRSELVKHHLCAVDRLLQAATLREVPRAALPHQRGDQARRCVRHQGQLRRVRRRRAARQDRPRRRDLRRDQEGLRPGTSKGHPNRGGPSRPPAPERRAWSVRGRGNHVEFAVASGRDRSGRRGKEERLGVAEHGLPHRSVPPTRLCRADRTRSSDPRPEGHRIGGRVHPEETEAVGGRIEDLDPVAQAARPTGHPVRRGVHDAGQLRHVDRLAREAGSHDIVGFASTSMPRPRT